MATKNTYWIKLYTGLLDNPKFMRLSDEAKWHYTALYLLAKKAEAGGWIIFDKNILAVEDIAFSIHTDFEKLENSVNELIKAGFVVFEGDGKNVLSIVDYEEQQQNDANTEYAEKVRENARLRKQKSRAKINNSVNAESESESEEESEKNRIEKNRRSHVTSRDGHVTSKDILDSDLKDNPQEDKQRLDKIRLDIETKTETNNLGSAKWYSFYKFVANRQKINQGETIDRFFDYLDDIDYDYKQFVGSNAFKQRWDKWIKKLEKDSIDDFCPKNNIDEPKAKKDCVHIPKYTPKVKEESIVSREDALQMLRNLQRKEAI